MTASQRGQAGTWQQLGWWAPSGDLDLAATLRGLPCNDMHAARLVLGELWPGQLSHASDLNRWHVWDGRCHRPDDCALIDRRINEFAWQYEMIIAEARRSVSAVVLTANQGADQRTIQQAMKAAWEPWQEAEKYAAGLRRTAGLVALRSRMAGLAGVSEGWLEDKHPEHLNTATGILHLPALVQYPHDPRAGLTYCLDASWNPQLGIGEDGLFHPELACPRYWALIMRAVDGNRAVAEYLVRAIGYSMIGGNPLQLVFFLKGTTGTGKSQLLNVAVMALGELAHESVTALVCVKRERNARVEYSIRGRRLITITETSGFLNLDEAQLKRLTGERVISVDRHYAKEQLRTRVTWVIFIATNEMPTLANPDAALQRRMVVIPMSKLQIPESELVRGLDELIYEQEKDGILALLARACADVAANGLRPPAEVLEATREYVAEQDTVANFLSECCVAASVNGSGPVRTSQHLTWLAYQWFCRSGPRLPKQELKRRLGGAPGVWVNDPARAYEGFTLHPWVVEQVER